MSCSYICRSCRKSLIQHVTPVRRPQWHGRATFISFTNAKPPPTEPHTSLESDSKQGRGLGTTLDQPEEAEDVFKPSGSSYDELISLLPRQSRTTTGRYSKRSQSSSEVDSQQENVIDQAGMASHIESGPTISRYESIAPCAVNIIGCLDKGHTNIAWQIFEKNYRSKESAALVHPSFQDLGFLKKGKVFQRLMNAMTVQWCKNPAINGPSPAEVVLKFASIGIMRSEFWIQIIWLLSNQALWESISDGHNASGQVRMLSELMVVWRLLFQSNTSNSVSPDITLGWPYVSYKEDMERNYNYFRLTRDFEKRLQKFVPGITTNTTFSLAALVAFTLCHRQDHASETMLSLRSQNAPFMQLIAHILPGANLHQIIQEAKDSTELNTFPSQLLDDLIEQILSAPSKALNMIGAKDFARANPLAIKDPETARDLEEFYLKRIARALDRQDQRMFESLWEEVRRTYSQGLSDPVIIPSRIYNSFLIGFMALKRSDRAIDTWNFMMANNSKPTVETWTAMLVGCEKSRDVDSLNAMWSRMLKTGIKPDAHAWTARIHGLMVLKEVNAGLAALEEMGNIWRSAEYSGRVAKQSVKSKTKGAMRVLPVSQSQLDGPVAKPGIETINAVVTAIGRLPGSMTWEKKRALIDRVLKWAGAYSIRPNAGTYNNVIRIALKEQKHTEVFKLLRQMSTESIEPDIATFTMILHSAFRSQSYAQLDEEKQTQTTMALLRDLEARGMKLNEVTYSSVINSLLKQHNNHGAVRAVMNYMYENGLRAGPYIYTILITHYFQQDPPNIPAVDTLWTQLSSVPGTSKDSILFDRMIEGYAKFGEVGKMMAVLTRMSVHGKSPGWNALTAALWALANSGDMERARSLVHDVKSGEGFARAGIAPTNSAGAFGVGNFWEAAKELGLQDVVDGGWNEIRESGDFADEQIGERAMSVGSSV